MGRRNSDLGTLLFALVIVFAIALVMALIKLLLPVLLVCGAVAAVYFYIKSLIEAKREKARRIERFYELLPIVKTALLEFPPINTSLKKFFSFYDLTSWKQKHKDLYEEIKLVAYSELKLPENDLGVRNSFLSSYYKSEEAREAYNLVFVKEELIRYAKFFDNIEGKSLDFQQRKAIVTDEDNCLVYAGAGSGKTTTIVGKLKYIMHKYRIEPSETLLISFTNKTVEDLRSRLKIENAQIKTFNKLGFDIITKSNDNKKQNVFGEDELNYFVEETVKELSKKPDYAKKLNSFLYDENKPAKTLFDFKTQGDFFSYLREENFKPYKKGSVNGKVTYKRQIVKSVEECRIANFLMFNGLEYEYEKPFDIDLSTENYSQWKPDFTITTKEGRKIYIEHFAFDKMGKIPVFFRKEGEDYLQALARYKNKMLWAQSTCKKYNLPLIETFSYEMKEGTLFRNLKSKLLEAGVPVLPLSEEEKWRIISSAADDEVSAFIKLIGTFIVHVKSNNFTIRELLERNKREKNTYQRNRNALFIDIVKPVMEKYEAKLTSENQIDFSDMINNAVKHIEEDKVATNIKYIIVDEFQDISNGRYRLLKALKDKNVGSKLFCVGDDWQSIYRFSGSDIGLFRDFEKYFGFTVKSKIETTYRFNEPLIKFSSDFILRNPSQEKKELKGITKNPPTTFNIIYSETDEGDDTIALKEIFQKIINTKEDIANKSIYILGRYSFDLKNRIKNEQKFFKVNGDDSVEYRSKNSDNTIVTINAKYMTVHSAKGLESDIVIVLNCNAGKYGFPSQIADDPVLNLVLTEADQFENSEERRLFYVAMTRAREEVFFVADKVYKSKFISEIDKEHFQAEKCPRCKTSDLVLRKNSKNGNRFYGCVNYAFGCNYIKNLN